MGDCHETASQAINSGWGGWGAIAGDCQLTFSNASSGKTLVAVCFLQSVKNVDLGPIGEHLLDHLSLLAILSLQLADIALVL